MSALRAATLLGLLLAAPSCGSRPLAPAGDGEPPPAADCEVTGYHASPVRYLGTPDTDRWMDSSLLDVTGGRVFFGDRRTVGSNSAEDMELFTVDAGTHEQQQLTLDELDTVLLDAGAQGVLYAERPVQGDYKALWTMLYRPASGAAVNLGLHVMPGSGWLGWSGDPYALSQRQLVDGGRAAWATDSAVLLFDGSSARTVSATKYASAPFLAAGTLVWSASDGKRQQIFRHRDGQLSQLTSTADTDHRGPVVVGGELLWLCGEAICRLATDGTTSELDRGQCGPPAAGGGSAAWGCGQHVARYRPGEPLLRIERRFPVSGVRVDGTRLAWVDLDRAEPYNGGGTLVFSDGVHELTIARVGLPCVYCDAYWPPLQIALSGDVLAWSYALADGTTPPTRNAGYGYTLLTAQERCD